MASEQSSGQEWQERQLAKRMSEWVWQRCPGCGRKSKHHPEGGEYGEFHSDGCPLEGLYSHTHQWWFERELEASLREVYEYMVEVESALAGHIAVRSYLTLPRTADERKAIGERARRLLEIKETSS